MQSEVLRFRDQDTVHALMNDQEENFKYSENSSLMSFIHIYIYDISIQSEYLTVKC